MTRADRGLREKTDFGTDKEIWGSIGEERLKQIIQKTGKRFEDTTGILAFRHFDIDFIVYDDDVLTYRDLLKEYYNGRDGKDLPLKTYECKTDTHGLISRNIVYENFSNSNPGCMARSTADYILYIFVDNESKEIKEEYVIDLHALRWWLCINHRHIGQKKFDKIEKDGSTTQKYLINPKTMRRGKDNTGIYLLDIDYLSDYSIKHQNEKYGKIVCKRKIFDNT